MRASENAEERKGKNGMNVSIVRLVIASVLIALGIVVMAVQTFGIFRLRYVLNRMHASAMGDSLGIFLIIAGLIVIFGFSLASAKLFTMIILFWFASPVCAHLLSKLEVNTNDHLEDECEVPEE